MFVSDESLYTRIQMRGPHTLELSEVNLHLLVDLGTIEVIIIIHSLTH